MQKAITIQGRVRPGRRLGRTLGFPTANIHLAMSEDVRAAEGVWLARITILESGERYWGLVNVGRRPTVETATEDGGICKAEAWLLDFDGDLYGSELRLDLLRYLRPERKFASVEELRQAMERDKKQAINIIENDDEYTL
ncbi:riboflavin kinase [uncultured Rikenella sp.]|uniref:riboflavin kinase n=1 Tax=uncultured Rikenella sp. TaxID=368003 RepID=UPI0026057B9B|nr:riboflavin kinase [uncultured Rikenella sp.]